MNTYKQTHSSSSSFSGNLSSSLLSRVGFALSAVLLSFLVVSHAEAANRYWAGGASDVWESAANWASVPKGAGGAGVPGASDTAILANSGSTVRLRSQVNVGGLILAEVWTGSLLQGTGTLTIGTSGVRVGSGRLIGGSAAVAIAGGYTQTGGLVTGIQNTFTLSGALSVTKGATSSYSTFTSTGTIILDGGADQTFTVGANVTKSFKHLTLQNSGGGTSDDIIMNVNGGLNLSGALTITLGNLDLTTNSVALVTEGGITLADAAQATLTTNSNVTASGTILVNDAATLTVTAGTLTLNDDGDQTVDLDGQSIFNLTLNNTGGGTNDDVTINGGGLNLSGALTVTLGNLDLTTNSQAMVAEKGITLANAAQSTLTTNSNVTASGTILVNDSATLTVTAGTWTLNDDGDQSIDLDGQPLNALTINNTGGGTNDDIIVAADSQLLLSGALVVTLGNLDLTTNTELMVVEGNVTLADSAQATLTTNTDMTLGGNVTVGDAATLTVSAGTTTLNGAADQTVDLDGQSLYHLTLNNTGGGSADDIIVAADSQLLLSGALTVTLGNLDLTTNTEPLIVEGNVTLADAAQATLTTNSDMTLGGNVTVNNAATFTVTAGTLTLNGAADQTVDFDGQPVFNLTVNNTGGGTSDDIIVAADSQLLLSGALVVTLGNIDLTTNTEPMVVEKGITLADAAQATLVTNSNVTASGTILVNDAATLTVTAGTWTLNDDGDQNVDLDGQPLYHLTLNNSGGGSNDDVILAGGALGLSGALTVTLGHLDMDTNALTLNVDGNVVLANSAQATLSGANMNFGSGVTVNPSATFTHTSGTVTLDGTNQTLSGSITFHNLTKSVTAAATLTFAATTTQTITNALTLDGVTSNLLSLRSSQTGTQWKIDPQGTRTASYLDVKDSNNTHVTAISCTATCTDSGNNTNWTLTVAAAATPSTSTTTSGGGGGGRRGSPDRTTTTSPSAPSSGELQTPSEGAERDETAAVPNVRGLLEVEIEGKKVIFNDVPAREWFATYVWKVIEAGIASGYSDARGRLTGEYGPANPVTYAEIAKMALEAAQKDVSTVSGVPENRTARRQWSEAYIKLAEDIKLSVYESSLDVNLPATRGAVIQTIVEALNLSLEEGTGDYKDLRASHPHARAIATATALGIISGDTDQQGNLKGTVRPNDSINRAEVAKILAKVLELDL